MYHQTTSHELRRRKGTTNPRRRNRRHTRAGRGIGIGGHLLSSEVVGALVLAGILVILFLLFVIFPTKTATEPPNAKASLPKSPSGAGKVVADIEGGRLNASHTHNHRLHRRRHRRREEVGRKVDHEELAGAFDYNDVHHARDSPVHASRKEPKKDKTKNGEKVGGGVRPHDTIQRLKPKTNKEHRKNRRKHADDAAGLKGVLKKDGQKKKAFDYRTEKARRLNGLDHHEPRTMTARQLVESTPTKAFQYLGDRFPDEREGGTFATLPILLDSTADKRSVGISFWVNLSPSGHVIGSKTLFATKASGCDDSVDQSSGGLMMYVNNVNTADEQLVLEYTTKRKDGTGELRCATLKSLGSQVPVAAWTHIGLGIDSVGRLALFINGKSVAESDPGEEHNVAPEGTEQITRLGQGLEGGDDVLDGNIAMMSIWHDNDDADTAEEAFKTKMAAAYESGLDQKKITEHVSPMYLYTFDTIRHSPKVREVIQSREGSISIGGGTFKATAPKKGDEKLKDGKVAALGGFKPLGGDRYAEYKDGTSPHEFTKEMREESDRNAQERRKKIAEAVQHAWSGYKGHAFGFDELLPVSKHGRNNWGGLGMTLVDSLDTLWLLGMKDEFFEARDWVRDYLNFDIVADVSVFETTIRCLGGLLSAYDVSGDKAFLDKADDLGSRLLGAFDSPSRLPYGRVMLRTGNVLNPRFTGGEALLAEAGSIQIEFRYLAKVTGNKEYAKKAELVFDVLNSLHPEDGLFPIRLLNNGPSFAGSHISFGGSGDSAYEYMLKMWLQGGRRETIYREMYDAAVQGLHDKLLQRSSPGGLLYISEMNESRLIPRMDHLACFMGGLLALGAYTHPSGIDSEVAQRDLKTGKAIAYTCYQMYARTATGLAPEYVEFSPNKNDVHDFTAGNSRYVLRPEAVETFYILHQLTGDPVYREWGWEIFLSIEAFCKTDVAYGAVADVDRPAERPQDEMESFFMAETLKYLYLLHDTDSEVDIVNKVRRD